MNIISCAIFCKALRIRYTKPEKKKEKYKCDAMKEDKIKNIVYGQVEKSIFFIFLSHFGRIFFSSCEDAYLYRSPKLDSYKCSFSNGIYFNKVVSNIKYWLPFLMQIKIRFCRPRKMETFCLEIPNILVFKRCSF